MAKTTVSLTDLKTKYKGAGIFTLISDESVSSYNASGRMSVLVPGFSKTGWYNRPFFIDKGDIRTARNLFGERDKSMEKKGSFFHKSIENVLKTSPVIALNLRKFNDTVDEYGKPHPNSDTVEYVSMGQNVDTTTKDVALYSSFFKKDDWFIPSAEQFSEITPRNSIISFVNLLQQPLSLIVRRAKLDGYDMTIKEWYGGDTPEYVEPDNKVIDYMVEVIAIVGDQRSHDLMKYDVLREDMLEKFLDRQDVIVKFRISGSLIPDFKSQNGENLSIEKLINSSTISHGVLCSVNTDNIGNSINNNRVDGYLSHVYSNKHGNEISHFTKFHDGHIIKDVDISEFESHDSYSIILRKNEDSTVYNTLRRELSYLNGKVAYVLDIDGKNITVTENNDIDENICKSLYKIQNGYNPDKTIRMNDAGDIIVVYPYGIKSSGVVFKVTPKDGAIFVDGTPADSVSSISSYLYQKGYDYEQIGDNKLVIYKTVKSIKGYMNKDVIREGNYRRDDFDTYDKETGEIHKSDIVFNREQSDIVTGEGKCMVNILKHNNVYVSGDDSGALYFPYDTTLPSYITAGYICDIAVSKSVNGKMTDIYRNHVFKTEYVHTQITTNGTSQPLSFIKVIAHPFGGDDTKNVIGDIRRIMKGRDIEDGSHIPNIMDIVKTTNKLDIKSAELLETFYGNDVDIVKMNINSIYISNLYSFTTNKIVMEEEDYKKFGYVPGSEIEIEYVYDVTKVTGLSQKIVDGKKYYVITLSRGMSPRDIRRKFNVHDSTIGYKPYILEGFIPNIRFDGSRESIEDIYSVISDTNMIKALSDHEAISFRYIVDTFNGAIAPKYKNYISEIAKRRDNCMAIINMPRVDEFRKHKNPRFTDSPTPENPSPSFDIQYLIEGGNKMESPDWLFSLPDEEQGASHSAFFFPNISVLESDGSVSSIPPASYVAACFMKKFGTEDEYKPSAGIIRGLITGDGVTGTDYRLDTDSYRSLIEYGVNPIIMKNGSPVIYGNETGYQRFTSALNNIHARDLLISISDETRRLIEPYVFDYNDDTMRSTIRTILNGYYSTLRDAYRAIESFKITIDRSNNPGWVIDNDGVMIDIEVTITGVAKKFINRITLKGRSANLTGFSII